VEGGNVRKEGLDGLEEEINERGRKGENREEGSDGPAVR